ncbi:RRQRL motif-containing zinc-binding protein [Nocardia goodfellowii]
MSSPENVTRRDLPDPTGKRFGLPTYEWRFAPTGLATRRQLRALRLRPNGQDIAAQVVEPSAGGGRPRYVANLYRVDKAAPKRDATPAQREAAAKATRERQSRAWERRGFDRSEIGQIGDPGPQWQADHPAAPELPDRGL